MNQQAIDRSQLIVVPGMSRAGTTFLYHNLQKHPQVYMPPRKESGYFSYHFDRGVDWYLGLFKGADPSKVCYDISGMYFMDGRVIKRILAFNPEAKAILAVRDPKEWIFSLYEQYTKTFDVPPFKEFLGGCSVKREGKTVELHFEDHFVLRTIRKIMAAFGENVLLYDFGLLGTDSLKLLRAVEVFSGIFPFFEPGNFNDSRINARDRGRMDIFYKFLHKKGLVDIILKLFPRGLIMSLRNVADRRSAGKTGREASKRGGLAPYDKEDLRRVEECFQEDSESVCELFKNSPLILGNGKAF